MLLPFGFGPGLQVGRRSLLASAGFAFLVACSSDPAPKSAAPPAGGSGAAPDSPASAGSSAGAGAPTTQGGGPAAGAGTLTAGSSSLGGGGAEPIGGASTAGSAASGGGSYSAVVHIAGDSTAAIFPATDPRVGWGAVFAERFNGTVKVDDRALSGRSTKSFIDEGAWTGLLAAVKPGDYVFIEFGHNDEKSDDPLRYTDPATTFRDNLRRFVNESRAAGGEPLLLTPISRNKFSGATITASHGLYPDAVKAVATDTSTPLIDMTERTKVWLEALGPSATTPFFAPGDQTHTSAQGAQEVSKLVAAGLKDLTHPLATFLQ